MASLYTLSLLANETRAKVRAPRVAQEAIAYNLKTETWNAPIPLSGGDARTPGRFIWGDFDQVLEPRPYIDASGAEQEMVDEYLWNPFCDVAISFGYRNSATDLVALYLNGVKCDLRLFTYTWYDSTQTAADPTIIADKGAANTMAFMGQCYIVIRNLDLSKFGNALPAPSAELADSDDAVMTLAESITERAVALAQMDEDVITFVNMNEEVKGFIAWEDADFNDHLASDAALKGFDYFESGDGIKCAKIVDGSTYTVDRTLTMADLLPLSDAAIQITRAADEDTPYVVICNYVDWTVEFRMSLQRARRLSPIGSARALNSRSEASFTTSLIMNANEALEAAARALFNMAEGRNQALFKVHAGHLDIEPGAVLVLPAVDGVVMTVKAIETTLNPDRSMEIRGQVLQTNETLDLVGESGDSDGLTSGRPMVPVELPLLSAQATAYAPVISTPVSVILPLVTAEATANAPEISTAAIVDLPASDAEAMAYAPDIVAGADIRTTSGGDTRVTAGGDTRTVEI